MTDLHCRCHLKFQTLVAELAFQCLEAEHIKLLVDVEDLACQHAAAIWVEVEVAQCKEEVV